MTMNMVFSEQVIESPKGNFKISVDFRRVMRDVEHYSGHLHRSRRIPFNLDTISPGDPMYVIASNRMHWTNDREEIVAAVRSYYEEQQHRIQLDASVLAVARDNRKFDFEPEPYSEDPEYNEEWDFTLPEPIRNLDHPIEKRLKQLYDMVNSSLDARNKFNLAMNTIFVEVERRLTEQEQDEEGFQPRRASGFVHAEVLPPDGEPGTSNSVASVGDLSDISENADSQG